MHFIQTLSSFSSCWRTYHSHLQLRRILFHRSRMTMPRWFVRTWIYAIMSVDLLKNVVHSDDNAMDAWNRIMQNFQNNNQHSLPWSPIQWHQTFQIPNLKAYCNELNTLAITLNNPDTHITDNRLVLQLLRGLSKDY